MDNINPTVEINDYDDYFDTLRFGKRFSTLTKAEKAALREQYNAAARAGT